MERVAITGIGSLTPLALSFRGSWEALLAGRSGLTALSRFDASGLPWRMAGEVKGFEPAQWLPVKEARVLDLFISYAVAAARMAFEDAGLQQAPPCDASVVVGSSRAGITTFETAAQSIAGGTRKRMSPFIMPATTLYMAPAAVARTLGITGECLGISTACASGAHAIGEAYRQIRSGMARRAVAGGTEAPLCRTCFEGYGSAGALSSALTPPASRPFDKQRDGFVLAEGASMIVLENYAEAVRRNAHIYAEIIAYANITDAHHMTRPHVPTQILAINRALEDASRLHSDIDCISAHGTSTPIGDAAESEAIHTAFGGRPVPVTAIKSMTGHMLAASAAFEVACVAMALHKQTIPPTINLSDQDPQCNISLVTGRPLSSAANYAMTQSFGFGGSNAVLILKRYT